VPKQGSSPIGGKVPKPDVKQPYYNIELAKICNWLRMHKLSMHVKFDGSVSFKPKGDKNVDGLYA
jgi:hypothetical protein